VVYFSGIVAAGAILAVWFASMLTKVYPGDLNSMLSGWRSAVLAIRQTIGFPVMASIFAGLWLGAASHTLTDLAGTYVKTGKRADIL
jgi:hypothetical protein